MRTEQEAKERDEAANNAADYACAHWRVLVPVMVGLVVVQVVAVAAPLPWLWSFVVSTLVSAGLSVIGLVVLGIGGGVVR